MYAPTNQSFIVQREIIAAKTAVSFKLEIKDQRAAEGESVKFVCKFAGTPRPGRYYHPPNDIFVYKSLEQ